MLRATREIVYPLVFVWAYVAIAAKHYSNNTILQVTLGLSVILLILSMVEAWRSYRGRTAEPS